MRDTTPIDSISRQCSLLGSRPSPYYAHLHLLPSQAPDAPANIA